jgi:hypothetical protein
MKEPAKDPVGLGGYIWVFFQKNLRTEGLYYARAFDFLIITGSYKNRMFDFLINVLTYQN